MDEQLETSLRSLSYFCLDVRERKLIRRSIHDFAKESGDEHVREGDDSRLQQRMHDAHTLFEPAQDVRLTEVECLMMRGDLASFIAGEPSTEEQPIATALAELSTFSLSPIEHAQSRACLVAFLADRPAMEPEEEAVVLPAARAENGFVSLFSSMLCQRAMPAHAVA